MRYVVEGKVLDAVRIKAQALDAARYFFENGGLFKPMPDILSDDFVFRGVIIGPLNKSDFLKTNEDVSVLKMMPDFSVNVFGYVSDPQNPFRVWVMTRPSGTIEAPMGSTLGTIAKLFSSPSREAKIRYQGNTEVTSLTFNHEMKLRYVTFGYVVTALKRALP